MFIDMEIYKGWYAGFGDLLPEGVSDHVSVRLSENLPLRTLILCSPGNNVELGILEHFFDFWGVN